LYICFIKFIVMIQILKKFTILGDNKKYLAGDKVSLDKSKEKDLIAKGYAKEVKEAPKKKNK